MRFLARPADERNGKSVEAEPLNVHMNMVANRAAENICKYIPEAKRLAELAWICGATHDFGKYTSYFQNKLPPKRQRPSKEEYSHHAFISAILGAFVVRTRYPDDSDAPLLVYLAIHRHHGSLRTPSEILISRSNIRDAPNFLRVDASLGSELRAVHAQIQDIREGGNLKQVLAETSSLGIHEAKAFLKQEEWWSQIPELYSRYRTIKIAPEEYPESTKRYWHALLLFSALIDADKHISAAASVGLAEPDILERRQFPSSLVDQHISSLPVNPKPTETEARLYEIRKLVYTESTQAIDTKPLEDLYPGLLSLTAPTGSGKTLTALGCAFRLRERIYSERGYLPRVIYALPFVNIINQNFNVAEKVLSRHPDFRKSPSSYLLKHHHLAPLAFREEDQDRTIDQALLLSESWESEVIVTTFVQLLETLITNRNRALKKLHNIAGSIVILDEVQSIPYEQWKLIRHVLTTLTESLGCTVLQMTATRPRILPGAHEIMNSPERHFAGLSRTAIMPHDDVRTIENLSDFIIDLAKPDVSVLVIMNTISNALEVYQKIRNSADELQLSPYREDGQGHMKRWRPLIHLSTNLTPWQRARRVRLLRRYLALGGKPIVIATQVVEAGVDLDFDVVVRDIGPLDSIVQAAGRCNRVGSKGESQPVHVVFIERDNGALAAASVYGRILPEISRNILTSPISEPELYEKLEGYFSELPHRLSDDEFSVYIEAINQLRFKDDTTYTVSDYKHIEEQAQQPIIVEINELATEAIRRLENLFQDTNSSNRHAFREAYKNLGGFIIAPNESRLRRNPPAYHPTIPNHFYIPIADIKGEYPDYYDLETGFKWSQEDEEGGAFW